MKLKVCGVRSEAMLQACEAQNIDYIGLNFVPWSKRKVEDNFADLSNQFSSLKRVGVFADQDIDFIAERTEQFNLDIIQLHGEETPEFISTLIHQLDKPVWKAFKINDIFKADILAGYLKLVKLFLFDGGHPGSGKVIDPALETKILEAMSLCEKYHIPYGIAGGINPTNIAKFTKKYPKAYLFDTASGVERDGRFDADNITLLKKQLKPRQLGTSH